MLALIGAAGAANAQAIPSNPPKGPVGLDREGYLRDSTGAIIDRKANRIIGSNTAQPGPGDYGMPPAANERSIAAQPPAPGPMKASPRGAAIVDEYGRGYDSRGDRIR
jgi:hypothetical protein